MKIKSIMMRITVGTIIGGLSILTLFFMLNSNSKTAFGIELQGGQLGISVTPQNELFKIDNFAPGDVAKATLTITNSGQPGTLCDISAESKGDNTLYNVLGLRIRDDSNVLLFDGKLKDLNKVSLGQFGNGISKTYHFELKFPQESGNKYQGLKATPTFIITATNNQSYEDNGGNDGNKITSFERLNGNDRTATAIAVAQKGWPSGADVVVLSRDDDFPDGLAAAPLAYKLNAPILWTNKNALTQDTENEIFRLKAKTVYIMGGPGAVSNNIENYLKSKGLTVRRIGGSDRFETAALIAKQINTSGETVIACGDNFPDAISISSWAAARGVPILLTEKDYIPQATQNAIIELQVHQSIVMGSTGVVSEDVANALPRMQRFDGSNRYQTDISVIEHLGENPYDLSIASGEDFADALAGSVLAAKNHNLMLLIDPNLSEPQIGNFLTSHKGKTHFSYIFGETGDINDATLNRIKALSGN